MPVVLLMNQSAYSLTDPSSCGYLPHKYVKHTSTSSYINDACRFDFGRWIRDDPILGRINNLRPHQGMFAHVSYKTEMHTSAENDGQCNPIRRLCIRPVVEYTILEESIQAEKHCPVGNHTCE